MNLQPGDTDEPDVNLTPLIDERRRKPGEDLLSSLATVEVEGDRLSDEEIFCFIRLLFPAGADTTYRALGSMFYAVLTHPEVFDAVKQDAAFIPDVVHESLRWEGPTAMLPRSESMEFDPSELMSCARSPALA